MPAWRGHVDQPPCACGVTAKALEPLGASTWAPQGPRALCRAQLAAAGAQWPFDLVCPPVDLVPPSRPRSHVGELRGRRSPGHAIAVITELAPGGSWAHGVWRVKRFAETSRWCFLCPREGGGAPGGFPLGPEEFYFRGDLCVSLLLYPRLTRPEQGDSGEMGIFSQGPPQLLHQVSLDRPVSRQVCFYSGKIMHLI